jgi:hypothetical protein
MSNFPLYDTLLNETKSATDDLTSKEKDEFMKLIKNIDSLGSELVYALIRVYQLENCDDKSTFKLPFDGKFINNDLKFDLCSLPYQLRQILYKFLIMHNKTKSIISERKEDTK